MWLNTNVLPLISSSPQAKGSKSTLYIIGKGSEVDLVLLANEIIYILLPIWTDTFVVKDTR